ncbi:hypothetical protein MTR_8g098900 [Medicago truncatula]|uniref:Uncharacterized protein n=1 Tax=Medicago truncatula TaxID=3880 RepID=A0A072TW66_MEDTR|nr:hypothetical protein MTR_8g098900 [Medicago truncatula]
MYEYMPKKSWFCHVQPFHSYFIFINKEQDNFFTKKIRLRIRIPCGRRFPTFTWLTTLVIVESRLDCAYFKLGFLVFKNNQICLKSASSNLNTKTTCMIDCVNAGTACTESEFIAVLIYSFAVAKRIIGL